MAGPPHPPNPARAHPSPIPGAPVSPKYVVTTAAIALAVVLAHQHVAAGGGLAKPKLGN